MDAKWKMGMAIIIAHNERSHLLSPRRISPPEEAAVLLVFGIIYLRSYFLGRIFSVQSRMGRNKNCIKPWDHNKSKLCVNSSWP